MLFVKTLQKRDEVANDSDDGEDSTKWRLFSREVQDQDEVVEPNNSKWLGYQIKQEAKGFLLQLI